MIHNKLNTIFAAAAIAVGLNAAAKPAAPKLEFEPPFWWAGMNQTSLQIMVHGDGVRDAITSIDSNASGAVIDSIVKLESPNYQLVYLNTANVKPGTTVNFSFKYAGKKKAWYYHTEAFRKKGNKALSMDEIRSYYGSTEVKGDDTKRLKQA